MEEKDFYSFVRASDGNIIIGYTKEATLTIDEVGFLKLEHAILFNLVDNRYEHISDLAGSNVRINLNKMISVTKVDEEFKNDIIATLKQFNKIEEKGNIVCH